MKRLWLLILAAGLLAGCEDIPTTDLMNQAGVALGNSSALGVAPTSPTLGTTTTPSGVKPITSTTPPPSSVYAPNPTVTIKGDANGSTAVIQLPTGTPITMVNGKPVGQSATPTK